MQNWLLQHLSDVLNREQQNLSLGDRQANRQTATAAASSAASQKRSAPPRRQTAKAAAKGITAGARGGNGGEGDGLRS